MAGETQGTDAEANPGSAAATAPDGQWCGEPLRRSIVRQLLPAGFDHGGEPWPFLTGHADDFENTGINKFLGLHAESLCVESHHVMEFFWNEAFFSIGDGMNDRFQLVANP